MKFKRAEHLEPCLAHRKHAVNMDCYHLIYGCECEMK